MSIILFAIIGAKLQLGATYWIIFGLYCFFTCVRALIWARDHD